MNLEEVGQEIVKTPQELILGPTPINEYNFSGAAVVLEHLHTAELFINTQPLYYSPESIWWAWNFEKCCWVMIDEIDLLNSLNRNNPNLRILDYRTRSEILQALKMKARANKPLEGKKTWIQFKKKIIDLETGDEFDAAPKYFITTPIPWELGNTEETPVMDRLFTEWVGEKWKETLCEVLAFCILPDYPLHRVICLIGSGRNGKSSFLGIVTKFVGKNNVCTTDFDLLITSRFESAKLFKKLVCEMGEINSTIFKRTNWLKKLTGGDTVGFELKGKTPFDDTNTAKLIIATNTLPETTDKTTGFYSRWLIIDFKNQFKENPNLLDQIPDQEYCNLARKCISKVKELIKRGSFTNEGSYEEREKIYEEKAAPINEFLEKYCKKDVNALTPFYKLHDAYTEFLASRGTRVVSKLSFGILLRARGFKTERQIHYTKDDGAQSTMRAVEGLKLSEEEQTDTKDTTDTNLSSQLTIREPIENNLSPVSFLSGDIQPCKVEVEYYM